MQVISILIGKQCENYNPSINSTNLKTATKKFYEIWNELKDVKKSEAKKKKIQPMCSATLSRI